jgi:hypothetical protein
MTMLALVRAPCFRNAVQELKAAQWVPYVAGSPGYGGDSSGEDSGLSLLLLVIAGVVIVVATSCGLGCMLARCCCKKRVATESASHVHARAVTYYNPMPGQVPILPTSPPPAGAECAPGHSAPSSVANCQASPRVS